MTRRSLRILSLALLAAMLTACTSAAATPATTPTGTPVATVAASVAATVAAATPTANPCDKATLATLAAGKLTIGTDNPAYPPYFQAPDTGKATAPWELGDPTDGQGFEAATAYAVAAKLGYANADVSWTVVPFDNSYKPGTKPFDIYLAQVSYTADRATAVDMSDGYYFVNQAIVSLKTNAIASAKTLADLKAFKFGAAQGTTAYDTINNTIAPTTKAAIYNSNDDAISALKAKQIDGLLVLHHLRPARRQRDRGSVPGRDRRQRRALQHRPGQGQPADGLRQQRSRLAEDRRHTGPDHKDLALGQGQRAGHQPVVAAGGPSTWAVT